MSFETVNIPGDNEENYLDSIQRILDNLAENIKTEQGSVKNAWLTSFSTNLHTILLIADIAFGKKLLDEALHQKITERINSLAAERNILSEKYPSIRDEDGKVVEDSLPQEVKDELISKLKRILE